MVKLPPPLDEIRPRLEAAFGARLRGVLMYGSRARGDHRPDSDLDILVLLDGREFGRHSAVEAAVHREWGHSGRVDREFGAAYTSLQRLRTVGDCGMGEHVSQVDARASVDRARAIVGDVRRLAGGKLP